jgi:hypothetical protein
LQVACTIAALSAVDAPDTVTHLPANVPIVYVFATPATGVNVNDWLLAPWQFHWIRLTLSAVEAPDTSMHRLSCSTTAVEVNATAAAAISGDGPDSVNASSPDEQCKDVIESTAQPRTMERALAFIESSDATAILDPEHRELGRASPGAAARTDRFEAS